jgi:sulfhydrogenase subunit delta
MTPIKKPTVAVYKFSSCDGCQLGLLNLEDELLDIVGLVEFAYFLEARRQVLPGPYDIGLVEGSISTEEEAERIKKIRQECKTLIAIGTCATAGGVQALRNFGNLEQLTETVYQHPEYIHALPTSTAITDHVPVDFELWGCPINKYQAVEVIAALLHNRKPNLPEYSVCLECKRAGNTCVWVASGTPCLGPITRAGCGAICPHMNRGCYGCFGPCPTAEVDAFAPLLKDIERYPGEAVHLLRKIGGYAPAYRQAAEIILSEEA